MGAARRIQDDPGGMSLEEIADRVGITRGGVWMVEQRAIRKIWRSQVGRKAVDRAAPPRRRARG